MCRTALLLGFAAAFGGCSAKDEAIGSLEIGKNERLLVVAPHPDDEALGAGGLIQVVLARRGSVRVVTVTAGDGYVEAVEMATGELHPRPAEFIAYGEQRVQELRAAVHILSNGRAPVEDLGFPDGGLSALLNEYWSRAHPERSPTTGESKVYLPRAPDRGAAYDGAELKQLLLRIIRETDPTLVAIPDPLDRHPDHSATGLFSILALDEWARETGRLPAREPRSADTQLPRLLAYLVHWPHWPPGWEARSAAPLYPHASALAFPPDLPERGYRRVMLPLARAEVDRKAAALRKYATQQAVMGAFLASFERRTEPFSELSSHDLETVDSSVEQGIARALARAARSRESDPP
ncbi:MAG TPA: PIG-L family deacetylase [Myxococcota bacterium]|nr:PIG-L family deacetylase [Myxococcota bacterium]